MGGRNDFLVDSVGDRGNQKNKGTTPPIQLLGRHVYAWDPHRKKMPEEGERHPINLKGRRGSSRSAFCSLSYE
jgi:hypothetical protein